MSWLLPACSPPEPAPAPSGSPHPDFAAGVLRLQWRQWRRDGVDRFTLERLRFERDWPGRPERNITRLDWGDFRLSVYDPEREALIFRQGFDTALGASARSGTTLFSIRFPMPRRAVRVAIEARHGANAFHPAANPMVDPALENVERGPGDTATRVDTILASGEPRSKVDLAILGDGYVEAEYPKFVKDATRAAGYLLSVEPFATRRRDFNVRSVFAASRDSGVTDDYLGLKKSTVFGCAYYAGGAERALADRNDHSVREVSAAVPYDFILILANARRYGGSSYFGGPAVAAIDSAAARYLVIHEFAHAIGGLADEYYVPDAGRLFHGQPEPWHPNVTTASGTAKWRDRLPDTGARPAPWNKAEYEAYFADYVKRYHKLRETGADEAVVENFFLVEATRQATLLAKNGNRRVGLFEGAHGYARGLYRSEVDCIMFSLQSDHFCAACSAAIGRMIDEHCG